MNSNMHYVDSRFRNPDGSPRKGVVVTYNGAPFTPEQETTEGEYSESKHALALESAIAEVTARNAQRPVPDSTTAFQLGVITASDGQVIAMVPADKLDEAIREHNSMRVTTDYAAMADACETVLASFGVYQYDGRLAEVYDPDESNQQQPQLTRVVDLPRVCPMKRGRLREILSHRISWFRLKHSYLAELTQRQAGYIDWRDAVQRVPCPPSEKVVSSLLARREHGTIPRLLGIRPLPFVRDDGSECIVRGYDACSGYYLVRSEETQHD